MPVEVVMPKLGLTMATGTIARWIRQPGEAVREGEPLVEVSTDKINYEVEAPASGTVARALGADGEEFPCGTVIGLIVLAGEQDAPASSAAPDAPARSATLDAPTVAPGAIVEAPRISAAANGANGAGARAAGERVIASPASRRLARERGIPIADVIGTGPRGRVTLADVETRVLRPFDQLRASDAQDDRGPRVAHGGDSARTTTERDVASAERDSVTAEHDSLTAELGSVTLSVACPELVEGSKGPLPARLPVARRAIYRKMTEVGTLPLPQVETVVRVDAVRALMERRRDFRWTAYAVYAVARILRDHPAIRTDARTGAPFARIDIGIAADTPHGLFVPVVRRADAIPLAAIETEIVRLASVARDGALKPDDLGGACFSISNVGPQGIERVAPLPDPPQTAILGIGAVTQRPAVVQDAVVPAWMMTTVLTFDHRFIDGAPAARFLSDLAKALADPGVLL